MDRGGVTESTKTNVRALYGSSLRFLLKRAVLDGRLGFC